VYPSKSAFVIEFELALLHPGYFLLNMARFEGHSSSRSYKGNRRRTMHLVCHPYRQSPQRKVKSSSTAGSASPTRGNSRPTWRGSSGILHEFVPVLVEGANPTEPFSLAAWNPGCYARAGACGPRSSESSAPGPPDTQTRGTDGSVRRANWPDLVENYRAQSGRNPPLASTRPKRHA
jgi:hypothetical protein